MAKYFDVHPHDPQPRAIGQIGAVLRDDGLIAFPTDCCYALGTRMDNHSGADRIRTVRALDSKHHFTLLCADFAALGQLVRIDNHAFRAIKSATPGPYTFILPATAEVPRRLAHPKKRTVGVRIPDDRVAQAILREVGEPLLTSTLLMPGDEEPLTDGWQIKEALDHQLDAVVDGGDRGTQPTTVVDYSDGLAAIVRVGAGDPARFE